MWDNLTRNDLERATQQLQLRREQMLLRHAEEIKNWEGEWVEVETLSRMAAAFAAKFKKPEATAYEAMAPANTGSNTGEIHAVTGGVSLFITQAQKSKLRELGIADPQIRDMKPSDAHRILGLTG
jgi:hypothetical protein